MKRFILSATRIRSLLSSNKLISALYFGGVLLAVFSMLFMYITQLSQKKYDEEGYYIYSARSAEEDDTFTLEQGKNVLHEASKLCGEDDNFRWGSFYAVSTLGEAFDNPPENYSEDSPVYLMVLSDGRYAGRVEWKKGLDLCAERNENGQYAVVIDNFLLESSEIATGKNSISLFGKEHVLLGAHGEGDNAIMFAPDDPCVSALSFKVIRLVTNRPLSERELDKLNDLVSPLFRQPIIHTPYTPEMEYRESFLSSMLLIAAFTAVSMIAFAFLFGYMLESRADEVRVMLLCGASRVRVCLFVLTDAFIVNLFAGVVSLGVFALVKDAIFSSLVNTTLHLSDYLIVLLCFMAAGLLVCCPMLYNYAANTIAEVKRRYAK